MMIERLNFTFQEREEIVGFGLGLKSGCHFCIGDR